MDDLILKTRQLSYAYPGSQPIIFEDLSIAKQQHTLILGDSGKGKSTLLNLIGGLSNPSTGTIHINQQDLYALRESELDRFRAKHIGFIFQEAHLLRNLTLSENIQLAQSLAGFKTDTTKIQHILRELELYELRTKRPNQLSRGQLQRAAIARAIINQPIILIADEPTASLDDTNTSRVLDLLKAMADNHGSTLIIATHDKRIKEQFSNTYHL